MVLDNRFKMLFVPHLKIQKRFEIESESNVVMRWAEGKKTHLINGLTPRYFFTVITPLLFHFFDKQLQRLYNIAYIHVGDKNVVFW